MMLNPRIGQTVSIRYNRRWAAHMPLHNCIGVVRIASKGKPRNHIVQVNGSLHVVPCGNLFKEPR